ncbi:MAG: 2-phosphosulfolactate phosphatase [Acidimicrobiales bacterium]
MANVRCHFGWGPAGALDLVLRERCLLVAIVDVLSFSTTVSVATSRGISIIPAAPDEAREVATGRGVPLAGHSRAGTAQSPWTLAPSRMMTAPVVPAVVLASPNGSAIASVATSSSSAPITLVAACLRNRSAAGRWLAKRASGRDSAIAVIAAGERWPDGTLRPALEDLVGAASLLGVLGDLGLELSPEAALVARCASGLPTAALGDLVRQSISARELRDRGFGEDVEIAAEVDVAGGTPVQTDESGFVNS